jgi:hypothetical protein
MLTAHMKNRIRQSARKHFDEGVSMAAFIYKRVEEVSSAEEAEEVMNFYVAEQKRLVDALENEADANAYQREVEM